jgi:hypothetical protein
MQRLRSFAVTTLSLLTLGAVLLADDAGAQQQSLKEQLVGTWTLVSVDVVRKPQLSHPRCPMRVYPTKTGGARIGRAGRWLGARSVAINVVWR